MDISVAWWVWIVLGLGLLILELATNLFVAVWFGLSALLVGIIMLLADLSFSAQLLSWTILAVILTWGWFALIKPRYLPTRTLVGRANAGIVGEIGMAATDICPFESGIVRFPKPI